MRIAADRRGISLLEAVVGLTVVGMIAVGALGAASAEMRATARARRAIEAAALASDRLRALDLLKYSELLSLPDSVARGRFDLPFADYAWQTRVATREMEQGAFDVVLRISWPGGAYAVSSALYRRPPVVTTQ